MTAHLTKWWRSDVSDAGQLVSAAKLSHTFLLNYSFNKKKMHTSD